MAARLTNLSCLETARGEVAYLVGAAYVRWRREMALRVEVPGSGRHGGGGMAAARSPRLASPRRLVALCASPASSALPSAFASVYSRRSRPDDYLGGVAPTSARTARFGPQEAACGRRSRKPRAEPRAEVQPPSGIRTGVVPSSPSPPVDAPSEAPLIERQASATRGDAVVALWLRQKREKETQTTQKQERERKKDMAYTQKLQKRQLERLRLANLDRRLCDLIADCETKLRRLSAERSWDRRSTAASKEAELAPLKAELAAVTHECEAAQRASGGQTKEDRRLAAAREETLLQMQIKINALLKQEESALARAARSSSASSQDEDSVVAIDDVLQLRSRAREPVDSMDNIASALCRGYESARQKVAFRHSIDPTGRHLAIAGK